MSLMHERAEVGTVWRHRKTGGIYVIVGKCQLENGWTPAILYTRLNHPGPLVEGPIARSREEFMDGRFEPVLDIFREYERGSWQALSAVLNHLNTYDDVLVDKKKLYSEIARMRPER